MFTCTTRFEIEDEQLAFIRSLCIYEDSETDKPSNQIEGFEPISDTEEDEVDEEVSRLSSIQATKRRKSVLSDECDNDLFPLPMMPESQIRASGRVKKRPKGLEGYEIRQINIGVILLFKSRFSL